jgi:hypothetical protein
MQGDRQRVILRRMVRGSVRAIRHTWVFELETSVVADVPGVADTDPFLINTWNTLLESYQ